MSNELFKNCFASFNIRLGFLEEGYRYFFLKTDFLEPILTFNLIYFLKIFYL